MPNEVVLPSDAAAELSAPKYPLHPLLAQRRSLRAFSSRLVDSKLWGACWKPPDGRPHR